MINYLKRLNPILPELIATILGYGVLVELIGVWLVEDKIRFSIGLAVGIGLALFMSVNIASSIWGMMDVTTKRDQVGVATKAAGRYAVVAVVSIAMGYFNLGSILSCFVGLMGLKVAAYAQPLIHKVFFGKSQQENEIP